MLWRRREHRGRPVPSPVEQEFEISVEPTFLAPANLRAFLGPDTAVTGRLSFTAPTRLDGTLRGEVHSTDILVIGETGFVNGVVRATSVIILGGVSGEIVATDRVEVGARGRLQGSIETRQLIVQEGAKLDGECRISPARDNVHVLHPRLPEAEFVDEADMATPAVSGRSD